MVADEFQEWFKTHWSMGDNRSAYKRVPVSGTADLTFHDQDGEVSIKTIVSDVSLSGLGIYADRQVADDTEVSIELNFLSSDDAMKNALLKGNIVYTREVGTFFFAGIEFTDEITAKKQTELYDYIQQALKWY